jgi:hypothetical protein
MESSNVASRGANGTNGTNNANNGKKKKAPRRKDDGWTVVTAKPRFKRVPVELPPELMEDLTPLEAAVHKQLLKSKNVTAADMANAINTEMNCSKSDVGNVLYGRLKPFVEADNWKERPRKWRLKTMKVKVQ